MKKIEVDAVAASKGSDYPAPYHQPCRERERRSLGDIAGLTDFGVNRLELRRPQQDAVEYPDIGLRWSGDRYSHRDGSDD